MTLKNIEMVKECGEMKANELLANGWVLISAGISNWSDYHDGITQHYSEVIYILGKPTEAPRIAPAQPCACGSGELVLVCDDNNRCAKCNGLAF